MVWKRTSRKNSEWAKEQGVDWVLAEGTVEVLDVVRHKETRDVAGFQVYRRGDEPFCHNAAWSAFFSLLLTPNTERHISHPHTRTRTHTKQTLWSPSVVRLHSHMCFPHVFKASRNEGQKFEAGSTLRHVFLREEEEKQRDIQHVSSLKPWTFMGDWHFAHSRWSTENYLQIFRWLLIICFKIFRF